ncbi:MAG: glycosyltransferase [Bacteroidia bacterium]|nr:glycosyltransferase [Bacteroidia bacterium]MCX7651795.1 glycosyltransferase [Bacteroidia bacterium]MDW8417103.1 glycosyltransferase [Bacteroidia bacterium]
MIYLLWAAYGYLLWRWGRGSKDFTRHLGGESMTFPEVSLLIPARNEANTLPRCLNSLLRQSHPPDEIWIIDDHSEDGTPEIARAYAHSYPYIFSLSLPSDKAGKKAALRYGLMHARGQVIITTDADTFHPPETIQRILRPFARPEVQVVGGWVRLSPREGFLADFQRIELAGLLMLTAGSWYRGEPITANGALLAYRRSAFEVVGGWGEAESHPSGDDDLLVQRILLHFGPNALAFSTAVVETEPTPSFHALIQQRLRWLSKRHLYPTSRTRWGLAIVGLAHLTFIPSLIYMPLETILMWLPLWVLQMYVAWRGFQHVKSPVPPLKHWIFALLLYPIYQTYLAVLVLIRSPFRWKGRAYTASGNPQS